MELSEQPARNRFTNPAVQFWLLQTGLPALGLALLGAGVEINRRWMVDSGVLVLASAALLSGAACVAWRRIVFMAPTEVNELVVWRGPAAILVGAGLLVLGAATGALGLAHAAGMSARAIRGVLLSRPGLALAPGGFIMLAHGLAIIIGFPEGRDPSRKALWNILLSIPSRLGGAILFLIGCAALAAGCYEIIAPDAFDHLITWIASGNS